MARIFNFRSIILIAVALVIAISVYGFAASNTVPSTHAGDGNSAISGFTIDAVHYALNSVDPTTIDTVTFTISPAVPAGGKVYAKLTSSGTVYTDCAADGTSVTCAVAGITVLQVDNLRIIAAQ